MEQVFVCGDCKFLLDFGQLIRSSCNARNCTGEIRLAGAGIKSFSAGVFSGLSAITSLWGDATIYKFCFLQQFKSMEGHVYFECTAAGILPIIRYQVYQLAFLRGCQACVPCGFLVSFDVGRHKLVLFCFVFHALCRKQLLIMHGHVCRDLRNNSISQAVFANLTSLIQLLV